MKEENLIQEIRDWISMNTNLLGCISTLIVIFFLYATFIKTNRTIKLYQYTELVELKDLKHKKVLSLPKLYRTEQILDKFILDINYSYNGKEYQSKVNLYWEYVSPKMERIITEGDLEKMIFKCKKENPRQVMLFIK